MKSVILIYPFCYTLISVTCMDYFEGVRILIVLLDYVNSVIINYVNKLYQCLELRNIKSFCQLDSPTKTIISVLRLYLCLNTDIFYHKFVPPL